MIETFKSSFIVIDYAIAAAILFFVIYMYYKSLISRYTWRLYWIGFALGFTWEFLCNLNIAYGKTFKVARFLRPLPTHFMVIVLMHSIWDGGLFLMGVWLVKRICAPPHFAGFRLQECAVLVIWGQLQELAVELVSVYLGGWEWIPLKWNPSLFIFKGHHITLLPQLIWFVAPIIFYWIALRLKQE